MAQKKYVSIEKLTKYDELLKAKIASDDAAVLKSAKDYTDESFTLAGNNAASLANTALESAKSYTDGKITEVNGVIAGVKTTAEKGVSDAEAAQTAANKAQGDVDTLKGYVGTFTHATAKSVVEYVDAKTSGIASSGEMTALNDRVGVVEGEVATIKGDYLKAADKTELSGLVNTEKERAMGVESGLRTDVDAIKGDYLKASDKTELSDLITAEANRAKGIEGGLETRLAAVEGDYLKASDKTDLQNQINTIMNNPDAEGAINSINEFTQYVKDHGEIAEGFRADIDKNKTDLAAEVKRAGEAEGVLSGRLDVLEAINHEAYVAADTALKNELNGEIAKKADASVVTAMDAAYKAADEGLSGRISTLEGKFGTGEGSVSDMISDAIAGEVTRVDGELAKKVDKVTGYGLSKNDLTDELKGQYDAAYQHSLVDHAPANAQANIIESVKVNGTALTITGKAVDISVPTNNNQLANGAGYLVASDIANKADKGTTLAHYGITDAYTSAQTDSAIATAMSQFVECSEQDILDLFK